MLCTNCFYSHPLMPEDAAWWYFQTFAGANCLKCAPVDLHEYASTKLHAEQDMVNAINMDGPRDSWSRNRKMKITTKATATKIWQIYQRSSPFIGCGSAVGIFSIKLAAFELQVGEKLQPPQINSTTTVKWNNDI